MSWDRKRGVADRSSQDTKLDRSVQKGVTDRSAQDVKLDRSIKTRVANNPRATIGAQKHFSAKPFPTTGAPQLKSQVTSTIVLSGSHSCCTVVQCHTRTPPELHSRQIFAPLNKKVCIFQAVIQNPYVVRVIKASHAACKGSQI